MTNTFFEKYLQSFTKDDSKYFNSIDYFSTKKLSTITINYGYIVPPIFTKSNKNVLFGYGGVYDSNFTPVAISSQLAHNMKDRVVCDNLSFECKEYVDDVVIYGNYLIKQWGHFLIDVIGRLWFPAFNNNNFKIVFTTTDNIVVDGSYSEFFDLLGINTNRIIIINKPFKFKSIIVPEASIYPGKYYTKEYKNIFDSIINRVDVNENCSTRKYYLTRREINKTFFKKDFGEKKIEDTFNNNGYLSVSFENVSLKKQISILNSASELAMTVGSLSHNLLFVRKNPKIFILNKTYRVNVHQFMINQISGISPVQIDVYISPLPILYGVGPFILELTNELLSFFDDNNFVYNSSKKNAYNILLYYLLYLIYYKRFLLLRIPIKETCNPFIEKSLNNIRCYYKKNKLSNSIRN